MFIRLATEWWVGKVPKNFLTFKTKLFFKKGQSRPLFVYFRPFLAATSKIQIENSVDGVLGIRTRGCTIVGADKTTEL